VKRREPRAAFTLIELVVVVAIIGLVLAVAAGSFEFLIPEYALKAEARSVGRQMALAKGEAAASGRDAYLGYDLGRGRMWLWLWREIPEEERRATDPEAGWTLQFERELRHDVHFRTIVFGRQKTVTQGTAAVRVTPMGTADHHIVNLWNDDGQEAAVKLNGVTGGVTFYDANIAQQEYLVEYE
jgi:prepilin-type N-terminal cleavage/methylation domain-containing protein